MPVSRRRGISGWFIGSGLPGCGGWTPDPPPKPAPPREIEVTEAMLVAGMEVWARKAVLGCQHLDYRDLAAIYRAMETARRKGAA
jgi:hypothetical protein